MAAGRVVLGHVTPAVRQTIHDLTGMHLPIVEATPASLEAVMLGLLDDRSRSIAAGTAGPAFVREIHDGRRSANALSDFLLGDAA